MSTLHPHTVLFARGILARLALWPALRLAVHASWGGPASAEKQRWLAGTLVDQFETFIIGPPPPNSTAHSNTVGGGGSGRKTATATTTTAQEPPPDAIYVEELLLQVLADEFDVELEDDSTAAVAKDIVKLFGTVRTGDETFVYELEAQAERVKGKMPRCEMGVGSGSEDESGSEWEDEDDGGEQESEGEPVPRLLNHSERQTREEPQIDEDGFTIVKKRGR